MDEVIHLEAEKEFLEEQQLKSVLDGVIHLEAEKEILENQQSRSVLDQVMHLEAEKRIHPIKYQNLHLVVVWKSLWKQKIVGPGQ